MRLLYIGDSSPLETSRHRAEALRRQGHELEILDPLLLAGASIRHPFWGRVHFRTGYIFLQGSVRRRLTQWRAANPAEFDVVWVNGGEWFGREVVSQFREIGQKVLLYSNDDPTGRRDGSRWLSLRRALPAYDLCAVVRDENVPEFRALGARKVLRIRMSCDEVEHRPLEATESIRPERKSEVVFIGTWMPERGPFLRELVDRGVPLTIIGRRWELCPDQELVKSCWRSAPLKNRDYVEAIQGAKICLALLSKGNRDSHTTRTAEIPFAGGLLCGERTPEHEALYRDGIDAVFFDTPEECAALCQTLLADPAKRERIRESGMRRVREMKLGNEDVCAQILSAIANG